MSANHDKAEALFEQALKLAPAERPAFLANACGDDAELRRHLDVLLQANAEANATAIQEKQTEGLTLQRELQTKQQQAQQAFGQAQQTKQGPVFAEIGKALATFSKERQLGFIFDLAKMGDGVLAAQPELEVTKDFIEYYNASHP